MRTHLAVVHPSEPTVLLAVGGDDAPRLPFVDRPLGDSRSALEFADLLGPELPLVSLGQLGYRRRAPDERADGVVVEFLTACEVFPTPAQDGLALREWLSASDDALALGLPADLAEALGGYLAWLSGETGSRGATEPPPPPHCVPGSTAALSAAMRAAFADGGAAGAAGGLEPLLPGTPGTPQLRQFQAWVLSSVWLGQDAVVKVTNPRWPHEPTATAAIGALGPLLVPQVIAHGTYAPHRNGRVWGGSAAWMVTRRFTEDVERPAAPGEVLLALAELQAAAVGKHAELVEAGVVPRGPLEVAADLGVLWASHQLADLTDAERAELPALGRWLEERLARLARAAPALLTHGDLHFGNATFTLEGGALPVIFDWTDATFSWPGVDLPTLAGIDEEPGEAELRALRDAYLASVRTVFSERHPALLAGIESTLDEGLALASVYHAVSYAQIAAGAPPRQRAFVDAGHIVLRVVRRMLALRESDSGGA